MTEKKHFKLLFWKLLFMRKCLFTSKDFLSWIPSKCNDVMDASIKYLTCRDGKNFVPFTLRIRGKNSITFTHNFNEMESSKEFSHVFLLEKAKDRVFWRFKGKNLGKVSIVEWDLESSCVWTHFDMFCELSTNLSLI